MPRCLFADIRPRSELIKLPVAMHAQLPKLQHQYHVRIPDQIFSAANLPPVYLSTLVIPGHFCCQFILAILFLPFLLFGLSGLSALSQESPRHSLQFPFAPKPAQAYVQTLSYSPISSEPVLNSNHE